MHVYGDFPVVVSRHFNIVPLTWDTGVLSQAIYVTAGIVIDLYDMD